MTFPVQPRSLAEIDSETAPRSLARRGRGRVAAGPDPNSDASSRNQTVIDAYVAGASVGAAAKAARMSKSYAHRILTQAGVIRKKTPRPRGLKYRKRAEARERKVRERAERQAKPAAKTTAELVAEFLAKGGKIQQCPPTGAGHKLSFYESKFYGPGAQKRAKEASWRAYHHGQRMLKAKEA